MSALKRAVMDLVSDGIKSFTHPIQGYIPVGGADHQNNVCTVRIPNPHAGMQSSNGGEGGSYIELKNVPLPMFSKGFLGAILDLFQRGPRGVVIGFKGSNMAHPYIISPLPFPANLDKLDQTVDARKPVATTRATTVGSSHQMVPPAKFIGPPQPTTFSDISSSAVTTSTKQITPDQSAKMSSFTNLQSSMSSQVNSATTRNTTPTVVAGK